MVRQTHHNWALIVPIPQAADLDYSWAALQAILATLGAYRRP